MLDFSQKLPPLTAEEIYAAFLNSLRFREGFGIIFLECSPAEANHLIPHVKQDLPEKNIEVLDLVKPINNLYKLVEGRSDRITLNILFVLGLEKSLEADIKPGYKGLGDYYNLNTIPPILSHLNQQRENFRDHFGNICFVFLLPKFAIRYFVRRAPDFYDWNSGVFDIPDSSERILGRIPPEFYTYANTVKDFIAEGNSLFCSGRYEEAIKSYDQAISFNHDKNEEHEDWFNAEAWNNRGVSLSNLGRYEEAIASYDRAVEIEPDNYAAWRNQGISLHELGRYEEAVASYHRALDIKPDDHKAWNNRGVCLDNLGRYKEALESYNHAI
jgi:tetratricopeptide (TPR) repeat protein